MKIHIPEFNHVVYPDAVVVCEEVKYHTDRKDVILNPLLIVEVLSPSTKDYDRSLKFYKYKTLPSFKEYVLVSQEKPWVCASFREKPNVWVDSFAEGLGQGISLASIDCEIPLSKIYEGVSFDPAEKS